MPDMTIQTGRAAEGGSHPTPGERPPASGEWRQGMAEVVPVVLAVLPFGVVFGALARDAGLTLWEAMGLSASVYAGASQLVILQLVAAGTPLWSVLLAVVAVNFRHVLYSASIGRHLQRFDTKEKALAFYLLVDPVFAAAETRSRTRSLSRGYYFGFALTLYVSWLVSTAAGFVFGALIGDQRALGLDLLLPIYFLALTIQFRKRGGFLPVFCASAAGSILVYLTLGSPWHVTIGGLFGIAAAALMPPKAEEGR